MAERKTLGAVAAASEGAGEKVETRKYYTLPRPMVNSWHKVDAVAERVVDRLPRSTS